MDCQHISREQYGWTASTPVESSGVLYGLPVHQKRVVELYMDSTPVEQQWTASQRVIYKDCQYQQRVVELYMDCQRVVEFYMDCQ